MSLDGSHTELFCSFFEVLEQSVFGIRKEQKYQKALTDRVPMHLNFIAGRSYTVYKWSHFSMTHFSFAEMYAVIEF